MVGFASASSLSKTRRPVNWKAAKASWRPPRYSAMSAPATKAALARPGQDDDPDGRVGRDLVQMPFQQQHHRSRQGVHLLGAVERQPRHAGHDLVAQDEVGRHACATAPLATIASISARGKPNFSRISVECWPTRGAGRSIAAGVAPIVTAGATT